MLDIKIDLDSELPIYRQIVEFIRAEIKSGNIRINYKLPTVRALADDMKISIGTAKHAYDILENQGIIEMVQGKGTFVCGISEIENNIGFGYSNRASDLNKREKSQRLIESFICEMSKLSFSSKEILMYLELGLKEKDRIAKPLIIGIVDYDKQRLSYISTKIKTFSLGDIYKFFIDIENKKIDSMMHSCDVIITPKDVYDDFIKRNDLKAKILCLNIFTNINQYREDIYSDSSVGIISTDKYFIQNIKKNINTNNIALTTFMNYDMEQFINSNDVVFIGQCFTNFATESQIRIISKYIEKGKVVVIKYMVANNEYNLITNKIKKLLL